GYACNFVENGYENTNFLGMLTEKDLKRIGIKIVAHRTKLFRLIQDIPEFKIPIGVPNDVQSWLRGIGLLEYKQSFNRNQIKTVQDMEVLKTITKEEIEEDLKITKSGHIQRLLDAIPCLRQPAKEERIMREIKEQIGQIHHLEDLSSVNREEYKFWADLIKVCLTPSADVFSLEQTLKENLRTLRNEWLMVSGIVNCLWIVIIMTISSSIDLKVAGTNILSLLFLIVFGFLFVLQFICMLLHRFTTLSHFIARAPYQFGENYRTSVAFLSRDLEPDANNLDQMPNLDRHNEATENTSLLSDHGNDLYQGRRYAQTCQSV
ncbi:uncharacterized protein LOC134260123, partial [Saccostrea cucullata]|uniref:uncharacterized protein LOC134260123 n=1 Tax=Saccostrea cuccullata TaxID=36930 RepID=UPI002ED21822